MSGLDEDLLGELTAPSAPKNFCTVGLALRKMDERTAETFRHVMGLPKDQAQNTRIAKKLQELGYNIQDTTVGRHRLGKCRCD